MFASVSVPVHLARFSEVAIEPLVLPHAYSHLAPLVESRDSPRLPATSRVKSRGRRGSCHSRWRDFRGRARAQAC